MSKLVKEVTELANELMDEQWGITKMQALELAVQIQNNRVLSDAFVVGRDGHPSALEAIAISIGYDKDNNATLIGVIDNLAESIKDEN